MNFNTDRKRLGICENAFETTSEHSLEADLNLPDYCPEIQRILKCCVTPHITSVQNASSRITVQGNAEVKLIYVGDNGKIAAFEQNFPIQKFCENSNLSSDCAVTARINIDYVNCRAVNSRRVDVRAMLTFIFNAQKKREENILCCAEGAGVQTVEESCDFASLTGVCEKIFSLNEVIEIEKNRHPVLQIINVSSSAVATEIKVINNKALVRGECRVKIYYISENENAVENIEHSMPISQIIEMDGVDENSFSALKLSVCSSQALTKVDSSGDMKLIDISVNISANMTAFEEMKISFIKDTYSTDYEMQTVTKSFELLSKNDSFNTSFTNKVVLESIGVSVDCVICVWCSDLKYSFITKDRKCVLCGTYSANVIYRDSEGKIDIIQKTVDFEYNIKTREECERNICFGNVTITGCACNIAADSRLDFKTEIDISGIVLSSSIMKYISNINVSESSPKKSDSSALTVYFSEKGEKLWDIARRYNTTVQAIADENEIYDECIGEERMILIPRV